MKTSTQRLHTSDGLELFGLLYEPDSTFDTILVHVHGMAGNFYENLFLDFIAKTLTDNGVAFFTFNNRGCELIKDLFTTTDGKKHIVRIGDAYEKFDECLLDIDAAIQFVKGKGYSSVHLSGHSLGAPKVAYYASERAGDLASVIFMSPADMVGLALVEKNFAWESKTAREMIAAGKGDEIMPGLVWWNCYLTANTYMSLSDKTSKVAIFNFYDPTDAFTVLGKIVAPAFTIMGRKDDALVVSIEETMSRVTKALNSSTRVETEILGDADHGYMDYERQLADRVLRWIKG